jgi:hypothetical protein
MNSFKRGTLVTRKEAIWFLKVRAPVMHACQAKKSRVRRWWLVFLRQTEGFQEENGLGAQQHLDNGENSAK